MLKKLSAVLLLTSIAASIGLGAWVGTQWQGFPQDPPAAGVVDAMFRLDFTIAVAIMAVAFLGYLLSFNTRLPRRPYFLLGAAAAFSGAAAGFILREWALVRETVQSDITRDYPTLDLAAAGLAVVGALIPLVLLFAFELPNRAIWPRLSANFDQRGMPSVALFCNWVSLLFQPGQTAQLKSVALVRFRKGNRGDAVDVLQSIYASGKADPDVLESLCKHASEQHDSAAYLKYLRELHEMLPEEEQIREALIDELIEQRRHNEALSMIEDSDIPLEAERLERYARVLLAEGKLEKATAIAGQLGEREGIPFRRSQTLLREVLSRLSEYVPALNMLATQAERMALRDQRIRWLEKSLEADPRQEDVRNQLIAIYRELGQTVRLESLLTPLIREKSDDPELHFEYIQILYSNEKTKEAMELLDKLTQSPKVPAKVFIFAAKVHLDEKDWGGAREFAEAAQARNPSVEEKKQIQSILHRVEGAVLTEDVARVLDEARANPGDITLQMTALERLIAGGHADKVVGIVDQLLENHPETRDEIIRNLEAYSRKPDVPFAILNLLCDLLTKKLRFEDSIEIIKIMAARAMDKVSTIRDGAQKILRLSPHHLPTLRLLGDTYLETGHFQEMIHSYSLYLASGGEESEQIDWALAKAYISLRDYDNARRFVNQLLRTEGDHTRLLKQIIPLALSVENAEDAAEYTKRLELADPRDPDLRALKPKVQIALGERRFGFLKRELEAGKGGAEILEQLGDIARDLSNFSEAITYYQRASRDRENERLARRCTAKLAYCYMKKRLDDLCTETLRGITISLDDDSEDLSAIMDILYSIGDMMAEVKMHDKAERVFKQLCYIDAGYRDVLQRIEGLRH